MPLSNLLKSAAGACRFCGQKAGVLSRSHSGCRRTLRYRPPGNGLPGRRSRTHPPVRREDPPALPGRNARRSFGDGATVNQALEEGWKQGVSHSMANG